MSRPLQNVLCDVGNCSYITDVYYRLGDCRHIICKYCKETKCEKLGSRIRCAKCERWNSFDSTLTFEASGIRPVLSGVTGLQNQKWSCYINALIQVLGQTPQLKEQLTVNHTLDHDEAEVETVTNILMNLLLDVNPRREVTDDDRTMSNDYIDRLRERIKKIDPSFSAWEQNDCHSFLLCLITAIKREMGKDNMDLFDGKLKSIFVYDKCDHQEDSAPQTFESLLIPVSERMDSVDEGLCRRLFHRERFDASSNLRCSKCRTSVRSSCERQVVIEKFPFILVLQLGRFKDVQMIFHSKLKLSCYPCFIISTTSSYGTLNEIQKYTGKVRYSEILEIGSREKNVKYKLYGIISHSGSLEFGHYEAYVKLLEDSSRYASSQARSAAGIWYRCNDSRVTKWTGCDQIPDVHDAYLLFYYKF